MCDMVCTCIECFSSSFITAVCMPQRKVYLISAADYTAQCSVHFRRYGNKFYQTSACFLPLAYLISRRTLDVIGMLCPCFFRIYKRSLKMYAHKFSTFMGIFMALILPDIIKHSIQLIFGKSHCSRADSCYSLSKLIFRNCRNISAA